MKILYCGDIVGRAGRDAVKRFAPKLKKEHGLDAVIVNVDNAAGGFGISGEALRDLKDCGAIDVYTSGDHVFDQKDGASLLGNEKQLLRPHNFPSGVPGTGCREFLVNGKKLVVLHLLGQVFHKEYLDSPFPCADAALAPYTLGGNCDAIVVDMHAEATSEKMAMGHYLDGRVSLVIGSHTHIPTADPKILPKGTAYQTDAGMCGDYNSVIGFEPDVPMQNFLLKYRKLRMEPASGPGTMCGVIVETNSKGLAAAITPIQLKNE